MADLDPTGEAGSLAAAIRAIARGESLDVALDVVLRSIAGACGAASALIATADEDRLPRRVVRSVGFAASDIAK